MSFLLDSSEWNSAKCRAISSSPGISSQQGSPATMLPISFSFALECPSQLLKNHLLGFDVFMDLTGLGELDISQESCVIACVSCCILLICLDKDSW